jgi:hypothetical protein
LRFATYSARSAAFKNLSLSGSGLPPSTRAGADRHHLLGAARMLDLHGFYPPLQPSNSSPPYLDTTTSGCRFTLQRMRDRSQAVVAAEVAVGIVDRLEAVDVDHRDAKHGRPGVHFYLAMFRRCGWQVSLTFIPSLPQSVALHRSCGQL